MHRPRPRYRTAHGRGANLRPLDGGDWCFGVCKLRASVELVPQFVGPVVFPVHRLLRFLDLAREMRLCRRLRRLRPRTPTKFHLVLPRLSQPAPDSTAFLGGFLRALLCGFLRGFLRRCFLRRVFGQRICVMVNRGLLDMTCFGRQERREFNAFLSGKKGLLEVFRRSDIARYRFEHLLFGLLGGNCVAAFRLLNLFKGLKP